MKFKISQASAGTGDQKQPTYGATHETAGWFIEIETLADLMALIDREGQLIIDHDKIIIYDDYVE